MSAQKSGAVFETLDGKRCRVVGSLDFGSVTKLLPQGARAIDAGDAAVIDLQGVTSSDSAGLALLLEWLSVAGASKHPLRYENIPIQLEQLASLSDVADFLAGHRSAQ